MADTPKSFSDYYAEAGGGTPASARPAPLVMPKLMPMSTPAAAKGPQDPLSWLMDIASRPLFGVTNQVNAGFQNAKRAPLLAEKMANGDFLGAAGEVLGQATHQVTAPLRGVLSTSDSDKAYTSDLIEAGTDTYGPVADNSYVDELDNVNPVVKGVLGLVGDIGLDPLTYVPGAAIVTGAKSALRAGKALTGGVRTASEAVAASLKAKPVVEAVEAATPLADNLAIPAAPKSVKELQNLEDASFLKEETKRLDKMTNAEFDSYLVSKNNSRLSTEFAAAVATPEGSALKKAIDGIKPWTSKLGGATKAAAPTALKFSGKGGWVDEAVAAFKASPDTPLSRWPKVSIGGDDIPLPVALQRAVAGDKIAVADLKHWHKTAYLPAFQRGLANGVHLGPLGLKTPMAAEQAVTGARAAEILEDAEDAALEVRNLSDPAYLAERVAEAQQSMIQGDRPITAESILSEAQETARIAQAALDALNAGTAAAPVTQTLLGALAKFKQDAADVESSLVKTLGSGLVNALKAVKNPENFDTVLAEMKGILDQSIDFTALDKLSNPAQKLLQSLGLDPALIMRGTVKWTDVPNTAAPAATVRDAVAKTPTLVAGGGDIVIEAAEQGLRNMTDFDIIKPRMPEGSYVTKTETGVARTDEVYGEGLGRYLRQLNTYSQMNIFSAATHHLSTVFKNTQKGAGGSRAAWMQTHVTQALRAAETYLDSHGVPVKTGVGPDALALGNSQIFDVLNHLDQQGMRRYIFNRDTAVPITNLSDAVHAAVKGGDRTEIQRLLAQTTTRHNYRGVPKGLDNFLIRGGVYGRAVLPGDELLNGLTDLVMRAAPTLTRMTEANTLALAKRGITEGVEMSDAQLNHLEEVFGTRSGYGDILEALADTSPRIQKQASEIGATQVGTNLTGKITDEMVGAADLSMAKNSVKIVKAGEAAAKVTGKTGTATMEAVQKASVEAAQKSFDDVADSIPVGSADDVTQEMSGVAQTINKGIIGKLVPIFSRIGGNVALHSTLVASENIFRNLTAGVAGKLNHLSRDFDIDTMKLAMQTVQKGVTPPNPQVAAAAERLGDLVGQMFSRGDKASLISNRFFANGASIHHVNEAIGLYFKGDDTFLFNADKAQTLAKANGTSIMDEMAVQWKDWPINDPADFVNKMYTVLAKVNTDQSIVQGFVRLTNKMGLASRTPKTGYARPVNESGNSILMRYMPEGMYYDAGILRQLAVVDTLMSQSFNPQGPLGKFIMEGYKPALDIWKYGMTLPNPTHHIRNGISDASLTFLALGARGSKDIYQKAIKVMGLRNGYTEWDAIAALQGAKIKPAANGEVALSGRLGNLTYDQIYNEFSARGNLPKFRVLENFEDDAADATGFINKTWGKMTHSRPAEVIGGISEARDHYFRLAHGIQFIEQNISSGKYKSMDDMLTAASDNVRKWHPDGSDLTVAEQGMRLVIPFYSWQRKAIPLILESIVTNPARVTAFPKTSFNLAVAMGVNPDSLAEPFPEDQMFPSYMTEKLQGPQFEIDGKYYAINPGIASTDVLNEYLGDDAFRSVLGSISPFIRTPFELAAGGQVGTGARINDVSDYLDSQIPGVGHAARFTGVSPTGSVASMLQGGGLDPQFQIAQGNKDPVGGPALAVTNWLTGAGIQNMSQENQINYAEIEKRNREGKSGGF